MSGKQSFGLRVTGVVAFLAGTVALSYGFAMSFLVPGTPGEGFFVRERVIFGVFPLLAALVTLGLSGWLFFRSVPNPRHNLSDVIAYCIGGALGAIFLFFIVGGIFHEH
ncbi:MAG: hypothetical protein LLG20_03460 [Acidobacteriales bacterium]|nr:hypothetical protein [Terriglobales bacterium]